MLKGYGLVWFVVTYFESELCGADFRGLAHTQLPAQRGQSMFALYSFMLCKELGRFKDLKTFLVYKELKCSSRPSCKEHFLGGTVF